MTTKHSAAPWGIERDTFGQIAVVAALEPHRTLRDIVAIVTTPGGAHCRDADARLIAAAPELLAALERIDALACADYFQDVARSVAIMDVARKAIAKAVQS